MLLFPSTRVNLSQFNLVLHGNSLFAYLLNPENTTVYGGLGAASRSKQNFGEGGYTTNDMISVAASVVDPQVAANKILIVWEIRNHLYKGATISEAQTAMQNYCLARKSAGWNRILVLNCTPTTGGFAINNTAGNFEQALTACNSWLASNYQSFADGLLDCRAVPALQNAAETAMYYDGIHLSTAGYEALIPAVNAALRRIKR